MVLSNHTNLQLGHFDERKGRFTRMLFMLKLANSCRSFDLDGSIPYFTGRGLGGFANVRPLRWIETERCFMLKNIGQGCGSPRSGSSRRIQPRISVAAFLVPLLLATLAVSAQSLPPVNGDAVAVSPASVETGPF